MTSPAISIWHSVAGRDRWHQVEVLANEAEYAAGECTAIVETFGYGWYANALPPQGEGTSSMVPGMIRRGNCGDNVEAAKAWCERICGLHPERPGDRRSEPVENSERGSLNGC